jgi:hypothetical protein
MYDELLGGGKEAEGVVRGLSIGADGEDEESEFHVYLCMGARGSE